MVFLLFLIIPLFLGTYVKQLASHLSIPHGWPLNAGSIVLKICRTVTKQPWSKWKMALSNCLVK